jgi:Protein of unknown function (DUF3800)
VKPNVVDAPRAFGEYIVYVDESGDHGLQTMDPEYPIFVLAFCIFEKSRLSAELVPAMMRFKFAHFGHDQVVLHEHEIRKSKRHFRILLNAARRKAFFDDLNVLMGLAPVTIVAVVIQKATLVDRYAQPNNPYLIAMEYGLERVCAFLKEHVQAGKLTHFIFECRGAKEDSDLELQFRRVTGGANAICSQLPVDILFADKKSIATGLQFADLVARPIGLRILRPAQPNRAFNIIEPHLRRSPGGQTDGWGLKVFPR